MVIKLVRLSFLLTGSVLIFILGALVSFNHNHRIDNLSQTIDLSSQYKLDEDLQLIKEQSLKFFPAAYNSTHLWSMRLADENYYRLARLVPCRNITYLGYPNTTKNVPMNHCDKKVQNEFSVESTLQAQKWIFDHQNPTNCTNKRFALIYRYAWSGFGSTIHQILWAFATALGQGRIAVYETPGNWHYGNCQSSNPDCLFLPISNCSVPSTIDGTQTIRIEANIDHWYKPKYPSEFQKRSFNFYRSQLLFYLMRFNAETLRHVHIAVAKYFVPPSVDLHRPYIAVYVRRSDKVKNKEMSQAYSLQDYFDLFDADTRRTKISKVYINSEDDDVFKEFEKINKNYGGYYKLVRINAEKNVVFRTLMSMTPQERGKIVLEFLTDLFIEVNADLHAGTLTSNYCRLVDEIRLVLGKISPYYTPEQMYLIDM
ncbi:hypothetical protein I4U23_027965 [Adineta vaga]|nr:hypothetical protein I4U23_027965 [Adineta vaga]